MCKVKECVEPGLALGNPNKAYLVKAGSNEQILFPHVDSCLAIALILEDGQVIGAHVGMQMPGSDDLNPKGNALTLLNKAKELAGQKKINKMILVGDQSSWGNFTVPDSAVASLTKQVVCNDVLHVDTCNFASGVDVLLDPKNKKCKVSDYKDKNKVALDTTFTGVSGLKHETPKK